MSHSGFSEQVLLRSREIIIRARHTILRSRETLRVSKVVQADRERANRRRHTEPDFSLLVAGRTVAP